MTSSAARAIAAAIACAVTIGGPARPARADTLACERALLAASQRLARTALTALGGCEARKRTGKLPFLTSCGAEPATLAALDKARAKLAGAIAKRCGGADKACGGADDVPLAALGWPAACPDLEGAGCTAPIADCGDVAACQTCVAESATDRTLALVARSLLASDPKTEKTLFRCQSAIAKEGAKLFAASTRALTRCWDDRARGKHANPCPDPGDGVAAPAITAAAAKARAKICKACGGADHFCDGTDDLAVSKIGFPPVCPGAGGCIGPVATIADLADCVICTSPARAGCAAALTVPRLISYPPGCGASLPTPTLSPTPPPTVTPTPTVSPTPVACAVAAPGTVTSAVTLTLDTPESVGAATLVLAYPPALVRLPASGGGAEVRARVEDLTGGNLFDKGGPNNQDENGNGEAERVRFTLVAPAGVDGAILRVTFDRCDGAAPTTPADYACTLAPGSVVATDGVTPIAGADCTLTIAHQPP